MPAVQYGDCRASTGSPGFIYCRRVSCDASEAGATCGCGRPCCRTIQVHPWHFQAPLDRRALCFRGHHERGGPWKSCASGERALAKICGPCQISRETPALASSCPRYSYDRHDHARLFQKSCASGARARVETCELRSPCALHSDAGFGLVLHFALRFPRCLWTPFQALLNSNSLRCCHSWVCCCCCRLGRRRWCRPMKTPPLPASTKRSLRHDDSQCQHCQQFWVALCLKRPPWMAAEALGQETHIGLSAYKPLAHTMPTRVQPRLHRNLKPKLRR